MATGPKCSRAALDVINNTYVVRNGLLYEYYPISVIPPKEGDKFIKLETSPGVMLPGTAIIYKELYDVGLEDLFRRRINVSKRHNNSVGATSDDSTVVPAKKTKNSTKSKTDSGKQGSGGIFGNEVSKIADLAWENQIDALLQTILAKEGEEFEITGSTQSGQPDEGSSVSDIFQDT